MFTYLPPIPFAILAFVLSIAAVIYIFKGQGKYSKNIMIILYFCVLGGVLSGVHKLVMTYSHNVMLKDVLSFIQIISAYIFIGTIVFITIRELKTNPKVNVKLAKTGLFIVIFSASILGIILLSKFFI